MARVSDPVRRDDFRSMVVSHRVSNELLEHDERHARLLTDLGKDLLHPRPFEPDSGQLRCAAGPHGRFPLSTRARPSPSAMSSARSSSPSSPTALECRACRPLRRPRPLEDATQPKAAIRASGAVLLEHLGPLLLEGDRNADIHPSGTVAAMGIRAKPFGMKDVTLDEGGRHGGRSIPPPTAPPYFCDRSVRPGNEPNEPCRAWTCRGTAIHRERVPYSEPDEREPARFSSREQAGSSEVTSWIVFLRRKK